MEQITFAAIIDLVSSLGTVGVLLWLAFMFQRGDILSRRVYEDLTTRILEELCIRIGKEIRLALTEDDDRRIAANLRHLAKEKGGE